MVTTQSRIKLFVMAGLVTLTMAVYVRIIGHDFIDLDDLTYIVQNRQIQNGLSLAGIKWAFTTTHAGNWHPLTWISHMLDVSLFGLKPGGHHFNNLLLHTINVLLLFHLLAASTGTSWRSAMVATLFAIHPLHVESVAWAAERKDVLSTLFFLLTLIAYRSYVNRPALSRYLLALTLFILGLMAKSMLVSVPIILFLFDFWPLGRLPSPVGLAPHTMRRIILEKLPFIGIAAIFCVITYYSQSVGHAVAKDEALSLAIRLQNALVASGTYLLDTIWPNRLAPFYPLTMPIPIVPALISASFLGCITVVAAICRQRYPYLITGWLWYLATLIPVIGFVQVGLQSHADRYTYIPLMGPFIALTWFGAELCQQWRIPPRLSGAIAGAVLLILSALCFQQAGYWKDSRILFTHTMAVTRNNYLAAMIIGNDYSSKRDFSNAIAMYQQALSYKPNGAVVHLLESHLATCFGVLGQFDLAISHYLIALNANPQHAETYYLVGQLLDMKGEEAEAINYLRKSVALDPEQQEAHLALARILERRGDVHGALIAFKEVLRLQPENPDALNAMGVAEARQGNTRAATAYFTKALQLRPTFLDAQQNLRRLQSIPAGR